MKKGQFLLRLFLVCSILYIPDLVRSQSCLNGGGTYTGVTEITFIMVGCAPFCCNGGNYRVDIPAGGSITSVGITYIGPQTLNVGTGIGFTRTIRFNTNGTYRVYYDYLAANSGWPYCAGPTCGFNGTFGPEIVVIGGVCPSGGSGTIWTWTGFTDNDWFTACNWDRNTIPDCNSDVVIDGTAPVQPEIDGTTGLCNTLTINSTAGGRLDLKSSSGGRITIKSMSGTCP